MDSIRMKVLCTATLAVCSAVFARAAEFSVVPAGGEEPVVERVGPPTYYAPDLGRYDEYRVQQPEKKSYIPRQTITRETYYQWIVDSGHLSYADNAKNHGRYAPRHLMPVLAAYVKTGEKAYGEACVTALDVFHDYLKEEVERSGWHSIFITEPGFIGFYRRHLLAGGLLDEEKDDWFREMFLFMNRNVHVWGTPQTYWRGPMHRSQGEGVMKGLAARWYPDAPEAETWKSYAGTVYQDWWRYRDHPPNDTGYYFAMILPLVMRAELVGDDEFFRDPQMQRVWERLMYEVSPDGAICPYGAHGGWNSTAGMRIFVLELVAARTGDGRYRYAAHKLMNYLLYQQEAYKGQHILLGPESTEVLAAAYLVTDDSIAPVEPDAGSKILYRKETLRIRGKEPAARYLDDLDPAPDKANICCGLIVTDRDMPSKLVLRSGWNPGDFFGLVDLFPRHDPLNVPGLLGLTRWGTALTSTISAKGSSDENRLMIEDLSGTAPLQRNEDPTLADPYYQEVDVPVFEDMSRATFARVVVSGYQGFPVRLSREFAFIKNRFLVIRDIPEFEAGFLARVGPVFNTENIGPQVGAHWANTFILHPKFLNYPIENPPYDLLVYFAEGADRRMQVVDRTAADPRTAHLPAQLRYQWQGVVDKGQKLVFTQLLYPHAPNYMKRGSNAAGQDRTEDLLGSAGASGVTVLKDAPATTVMRCSWEAPREEWIVLNPGGGSVGEGDLETDAGYLYLDARGTNVAGVAATDATFASWRGRDVFRQTERGTFAR